MAEEHFSPVRLSAAGVLFLSSADVDSCLSVLRRLSAAVPDEPSGTPTAKEVSLVNPSGGGWLQRRRESRTSALFLLHL